MIKPLIARKYSENIDIYLAPLYKDTIDIGILDYFQSRAFERLTINQSVVSEARNNLLKEASPENYGTFLNQLQKGYSEPNYRFIVLFLIDFINWINHKVDLTDVLLDIAILRTENYLKDALNAEYQKHNERFKPFNTFIELSTKKTDLITKSKLTVQNKVSHSFSNIIVCELVA